MIKICVLFLMLSAPALAADITPAKLASEIEGVYKHRFQNGKIVSGKAPGETDESYESEDIIELLAYDEANIYFRVGLQFYNGHVCSISGIAGYENGAFIYRDTEVPLDGNSSCKLKISLTKTALQITDRETPDALSSCKMHCGVRGSLSDYKIAKSAKRKIRYINRLKASRQYIQAVQAFSDSAR